ncbi:NAD(P)H-hydrate dehydratase [Demequina oxidasica]|uniref:NAD(P)H-hydrate dehydratase n=1 Tax=Demequina oxidasica TaxID=676199 RepID=UPI000780AB25|nr:NAD(P)H-hydrate dehydratase [Demequina oxidasica]
MSDAHEWSAADVERVWPVPSAGDDKYSRGVLGVVAGSDAYPGAAVLVVNAAVRAGAAFVRYIGPRRAQDLVLARHPEVVVHAPSDASDALPRCQAWVVGPGIADHPEQDAVISAVTAAGLPMVVDAGALEAIARARASGDRAAASDSVLLTPHANELVRTLKALRHDVSRADVDRDRAGHARLLAETARATVLLKGSRTIVVSPGGAIVTLPEATPWLATAGSGDTLAGIAGTLLAGGLSAADAGASAAWIHAQAGVLASDGGPISALDVADMVPTVIAAIVDQYGDESPH